MILIKLIALIGTLPWYLSPVFALLFKQFVPRFDEIWLPTCTQYPRLSVLVPACNEEDTIERALEGLRAQRYPNLEIIVVNDRSTDRTGEIVDRIAALDERVQAIHVDHLPDGWLGKVHALHIASQQATGEWMLFTDADIHFSGTCLEDAVQYCVKENLDHLSLLPKMSSRSLVARFGIVSALRAILVAVQPWHVNDPTRSEGVGVGAFNLVNTQAFQDSPGLEWFKMDVADDLALGQMMKNVRGRSQVMIGSKDVFVEWYPTVEAVFYGLEKNAYAQIARCDYRQGMLVAGLAAWISLSPWMLLLIGENFWGVAPWMGAIATAIILSPIMAVSILDILGSYLIGDLLMAAVIARATKLGDERGGVIWRGTVYTSEELRRNMKVRFGDWLVDLLQDKMR